MVSSLTKAVHCIFSCLGLPSREWFRSIDLWVMGPARFRCATLLFPHPRWDSNPQSPAPEADALSIRPLGHHVLATEKYSLKIVVGTISIFSVSVLEFLTN